MKCSRSTFYECYCSILHATLCILCKLLKFGLFWDLKWCYFFAYLFAVH